MAVENNIQMKIKHGDSWELLYPITKIENVYNLKAFAFFKVGETLIPSTTSSSAIEFTAGDNVILEADSLNKKIKISASGNGSGVGNSNVTDAEKSYWNAKEDSTAALDKYNSNRDYTTSYVNEKIQSLFIPTKTSQLLNDLKFATETYVNTKINESLATITPPQVDTSLFATKEQLATKADKNHTHTELHAHSNKSTIDSITSVDIINWNKKSEFDGNYNSLTNKPTMPTKLSQLSNDTLFTTESFVTNKIAEAQLDGSGVDLSGYATKDDLITKANTNHTHNELHEHTNITVLSTISESNILSWNNKSNFDGNYQSLSNKPNIPATLSELTNDAYYTTESFVTTKVNDAKTELNNKINNINTTNFATKEEIAAKSDLNHTHNELHAHINRTVLDSITSNDISKWNAKSNFSGSYNDLLNKPTVPDSTSDLIKDDVYTMTQVNTFLDNKVNVISGKGLSTNDFSNVYKLKLEGLTNYIHPDTSTIRHVTDTEKNTWNAKSNFSGNYNDLANKPFIPSKYSDLLNDLQYLTQNDLRNVTGLLDTLTTTNKENIVNAINEINNKLTTLIEKVNILENKNAYTLWAGLENEYDTIAPKDENTLYFVEDNPYNIWVGTQTEYDAIITKDDSTLYFIEETPTI